MNDISGFTYDPNLALLCAERGCAGMCDALAW